MMMVKRLFTLGCFGFAITLLAAQPMKQPPAPEPVVSMTVGAALPDRQPGPLVSLPDGVVSAARGYLGAPYVSGGVSLQGVDCSGLVYRVFRDMAGLDLPRGVVALFHSGDPVLSPLHIGDLLFFDTAEGRAPSVPTHVGVFAGGEKFVHAASEGSTTGVIVSLRPSQSLPTTGRPLAKASSTV